MRLGLPFSSYLGGLLAAVWCAAPVFAGSTIRVTLPAAPKTFSKGLQLTIASDWVESPGYRPITIDIICLPPVTADRTLNIEVSATDWRKRKTISAFADLRIGAGQSSVRKTITLPQYAVWQGVALEVRENGSRLDDLSFDEIGKLGVFSAASTIWADTPAILFVAPAMPDLTQFAFLTSNTPPNFNRPPVIASPGFKPLPSAITSACQDVASLSTAWIDYSCLDVVCMSLSDAESLAAQRPLAWSAVQHWTQAGGNLCVYGMGADWGGLPRLELLLGTDAAGGDTSRGWHEPKQSDESDPAAQPNSKLVQAPGEQPFVLKPVQLGQVVAMADMNPFPGDKRLWRAVFDNLGPARVSWASRHGLSLGNANPSFDNFLIADVGLPPVQTYRVLITLFVIGIGPLNYWLLYRNNRLHLLLFTVPAGAALVSGLLLGYVFVGDGLSSWLRARSFTHLDQRTHHASSWARLSYYAGLTPSGGLMFPADTVIVPLDNSASWEDRGRARSVFWNEDQQHLARGWLASRTPTQYLALRAFASDRELKISEGDVCTVRNHLGTRIRQLLVCDSGGGLHFGQDLDTDATAALRALSTDEAKQQVARGMAVSMNRDQPAFPEQVNAGKRGSSFWGRAPRTVRGFASQETDTWSSLLERRLADTLAAVKSEGLANRSYIAIVERPADVGVGVEGFTETQSLHVIFGTW